MTRFLLILSLLVAAATLPASAQTAVCEANCAVRVGQSFVAFTEAEASATQYWLTVDGVNANAPGTIVNGFIEFSHPGFATAGNHVLVISMQTPLGVIQTDPLTLAVVRKRIKIRG